MGFNSIYSKQVELLLEVLLILNKFDCFALKGGTAINLFLRDMPRLSVDIDLAYLPIEPREIFLKNITTELLKMKQHIEQKNFQVQTIYIEQKQLSKLIVHHQQANIKIEPNFIIRGSVFDCETHQLCQRAQDQFLKYVRIKTLSIADLYGGKICAALARQHPRDLFDVKLLLENEGLTDQIRQALIVYLMSSPRPIAELLDPKLNTDHFKKIFEENFLGMTDIPVSPEELLDVRKKLINQLLKSFTPDEKKFLLSVKSGAPDWSLMPISRIEQLPAVQWKLKNIQQMNEEKQRIAFKKLKKILAAG